MDKEKFLKEYLVERKGTNSLKWDALDKRFGNLDLISMWVADMEFKTPKEIVEALKERIEHGVFGYSYVSDDYYNVVIKWHKEKHNYEIKNLMENPVISPLLDTLVFKSENNLGYYSDGTLVTVNGEILELEESQVLKIAHALDLYNSGKWSDERF